MFQPSLPNITSRSLIKSKQNNPVLTILNSTVKKVRTARLPRLMLPLLLLLAITGCKEEPGVVGESFVESSQSFQFDTLFVNNLQPESSNAYTGRLQRIAVGNYTDPIFGDMITRALVKPIITDLIDLQAVFNTSEMELRLQFDTSQFWGDTTVTNQYNIYRVENLWRGIPWLSDDQVQFNEAELLATFDRRLEEIVTIPLPEDWVVEYAALYNADDVLKDSLFSFEFDGLVIEPVTDNGAIGYINIANTVFAVKNPLDTAFVEIPLGDWAYSIERENAVTPNDRLMINTNNDVFIRGNFFDQLSGFEQSNIVKAELVLYRDTLTLQNNLPAGHVRPKPNFLLAHQNIDLDPIYEFSISGGDSLGRPDDVYEAYRFNLTAYVNRYLFGDGLDDDFYFTIFERTGVVRSELLHDSSTGDADRRPIVIITRIEEE